jgi:hypothetical protein
MPVAERFGSGQGTTLGVQARAISGITTISVDGIAMVTTEILPERNAIVAITVDGDAYELVIQFTEDMFEQADFKGQPRKRINE